MSRTLRACLAIAVAMAWSGASLAQAGLLYIDPLYGYSKTSDIVYGTGAQTFGGSMPLLLDVYQPTNIGLAAVQANRPAIVIQDGGAWTSGSKDNGRVVTPAIYLAQRGYTVFIADYRQVGDSPVSGPGPWQNLNFSGNGSTMGALVQIYPGANVIRSGIQDFATAISHVRTNATTYGINASLIAAAGGSAGGVNVMDLQYNNNPVDASYRAQAVLSLVGTMYGDWDKMQPGGPPLFLLNNPADGVIWYGPDVEPNLHNRLEATGIYHEQWMQEADITSHGVDYDYHPLADTGNPWLVDQYGDNSKNVLERMRDFLAYHFNSGPVQLPGPIAMSVTSIEDQTVWNLDSAGAATAAATSANGLLGPIGATHDAAGNLYVSDFLQGSVLKVNTAGAVTTFATGAGAATPAGLSTDAAGNVLVSNYLVSQVHALDSAGAATLRADAGDLLNQPFASVMDAAGNTYAANLGTGQIVKIDSAGNATVFAGPDDGLLSPVSLAVDAAGNVYVGDALLGKVFKFNTAGAGGIFADAADGVVTPTGLDFDASGNLLVANYLGNNVLKITPAGIGSVFSSLNRPFGVSAFPGASAAPPFAAPVPEPSAWALALIAAATLAASRLRRR